MKQGLTTDTGTTLLEVLAAIFVMGIGLLALLTLFPLGALEMAQAINDDRTAAIAANARAFSDAGEDLLARTASFVEVSLSNGSVDPVAATELRHEYDDLADEAATLEAQLEELQQAFPHEQIQQHVGPLLGQIRAIRHRIDPVIVLLSLVE